MTRHRSIRSYSANARRFALLGFLLCSLLSVPAFADEPAGVPLEALESGSLEEQLERDVTPIPTGMGALFVPSLTTSDVEPPVLVYYGKDRVAWGRTGKRIVLPPGEYKVVFGHGPQDRRPSMTVRVVDGVTTPIESFFSALRLTAVDSEGNPVEIDYTLTNSKDQHVWGSGETSKEYGYDNTRTWILPNSPVVISLPGGSALTVPVMPGEVLRYQLIVDNNRIVSSRIATQELVESQDDEWLRLRLIVGSDLGFQRLAGQLGSFNGDYLQLGAFGKGSIGIDTGQNLLVLNLNLNENWVAISNENTDDFNIQKIRDEFSAELMYNFRIGGIVGPYVRGQARTSFFETNYITDRDVTATLVDGDGNEVGNPAEFEAGDSIKLFNDFNPLEFREGVGLGLTLVDNSTVTFILRAGGAARQAYFGNGRFVTDLDGDQLSLVQIADDESFGAEGGLVAGLRLADNFDWEVNADLYMPFDQVTADEDFNPIVRVDNTFTFSAGQFLAVVYDLNIRKDAYEIDDYLLSHIVSLRLQYTLF